MAKTFYPEGGLSTLSADGALGGGGGVNSFATFNRYEPRLEFDGQVWLATGFLDTDVASYPDAHIYKACGALDGASVAGSTKYDAVSAGTNIWVLESGNKITEYDETPAATGRQISIPSDIGAIEFDGTHIVAMGQSIMYYYNLDGTTDFSVSHGVTATTDQRLAWDESRQIMLAGGNSSTATAWLNKEGLHIGWDQGVPNDSFTQDFLWDQGIYFYINDNSSTTGGGVFAFAPNDIYNNSRKPYSIKKSDGGAVDSACRSDNYWWFVDNSFLYRAASVDTVGHPVPMISVSGTTYVRVK